MASHRPAEEDPVNMVKLMARNVLDGIFDDFMGKNVLNGEELRKIGQDMNFIKNKTENLVENITEKTQKAGKILANCFFKPPKHQSLKSQPESEDEESESSTSSSSTTESSSEDESEDSEREEEAASAQALALPSSAPLQTLAAKSSDKLKLCPPDRYRKLKIKKAKEIYPVMEKEGRTRLALIICNKEFDYLSKRHGAEIDIFGMKDLLENLGYSVVVKENLTAQEMETELRQFAARPEHRFSDSTFLVFMSHGILDGICGRKHRDKEPDILNDDTIFRIFNNCNCQNLKDKPKIIITQACRGKGAGIVWMADMGEDSAALCSQLTHCSMSYDAVTKAHVEKDFIAFKSSTPHNISWRLHTDGSLFISRLIHCFKEYSWCCHLEEVFRKVQNSFETPSELMQLPTIERQSMTRYFYLFPGN
ncbi:caspase-12-like [Dasypus novemcinctus]|uniref:caspase-12-like n=1 Tax=Dasypus novemcinctus TaxID=9361 RepID=UPI000328F5C5|nr:caspase-12-like [Dasypus novemcinctus]